MRSKQQRTCFVTNLGPHYRLPIYRLMDKELSCDFYLGDRIKTRIKTFDYQLLKRYRKTVRNVFLGKFYWQRETVPLVFSSAYDCYIFDGEPYILSSWVMLLAAYLCRKKTVAWTHGWYGRETTVKKLVKRLYFNLFDHLLVYGEHAIRLMEKQGIPREKMSCIANSLDSERHREMRQEMTPSDCFAKHFGNEDPTIIYCGRIQTSKSIDLLIDALHLLRERGIHANLLLVGDIVDESDPLLHATKCGLQDRVWMYGGCYDEALLAQLFYDAHVCVSPGNVGLTAIHALSFGCPVITHDNFKHQGPEFEAVKPQVTGDFFRQHDVQDLADKIQKWITADIQQRGKTRKAAYQEIDRKWNVDYQLGIISDCLYNLSK